MNRDAAIIQFRASPSQIISYLTQNNSIFVPPLHRRIDIEAFSNKIFKSAIQFWVMSGEEAVGFMACYFNDPTNDMGYITTISVTKFYQGAGIGGRLLDAALTYAFEKKYRRVGLEVNHENIAAVRLYRSRGFTLVRKKGTTDIYEMNLGQLSGLQ